MRFKLIFWPACVLEDFNLPYIMSLALQEPSRSPPGALQEPQCSSFLFSFSFSPAVGWKRFLLLRDTWTRWKVIITRGRRGRRRRDIAYLSLVGFVEAGYPMLALRNAAVNWQSLSSPPPSKVNHTPRRRPTAGNGSAFHLHALLKQIFSAPFSQTGDGSQWNHFFFFKLLIVTWQEAPPLFLFPECLCLNTHICKWR